MTTTPQKITFGEMRAFGVRGVLIYCRDHRYAKRKRSVVQFASHDAWCQPFYFFTGSVKGFPFSITNTLKVLAGALPLLFAS
jgi:hypothetical protein